MREDASALVTIGRATVSMTHDLNNLLLVIGGYAEAIQREQDIARLGTMAERIEGACVSASRMTRYILSLVQHQDERPAQLDVIDHLESIAGILGDLAGTLIDVQLDLPEGPIWVSMRRSFLDQILINLVVNSREAHATSIKIRALEIGYANTALAPQLLLEVQDNGKGFSQSALSHGPREYFSEGKPGGKGIGLATVERLARISNGSLALENRRNQFGAIAKVQLPLSSSMVAIQG